jgi:hypothetical protein
MKKFLTVVVLASLFVACKKDLEPLKPKSGTRVCCTSLAQAKAFIGMNSADSVINIDTLICTNGVRLFKGDTFGSDTSRLKLYPNRDLQYTTLFRITGIYRFRWSPVSFITENTNDSWVLGCATQNHSYYTDLIKGNDTLTIHSNLNLQAHEIAYVKVN